jgi:hypothetical protein
VRVVPSGLREFEVELYVRDEELGRRLVDRAALVPRGPTHFVSSGGPGLRPRPVHCKTRCRSDDLARRMHSTFPGA